MLKASISWVVHGVLAMTVAYSAFRPVSAILLACSLIGCGGDTESAAQADDPLATGAGFIALTTTLLGGDAISQ